MDSQQNSYVELKPKASAKDFFLNLGAIIALFTVVISLINLLFTAINHAYPQISAYSYSSSGSISFPVATLIIFFPIYILLVWLLQKSYVAEPEKKHLGIRKWLAYITLFIAGLTFAGDLVSVLYYFIDGQEITTGFILKVLMLLVIAAGVFLYYLLDIREKITSAQRKLWLVVSFIIIFASIIWGFAVLGSPRTQQLIKYDEQRVSDLQNMNNLIENYYSIQHMLPATITESQSVINSTYYVTPTDPQTHTPYGYTKTGDTTYELCATFNKKTDSLNTNSPEYTSYQGSGI